MTYGYNPYIGAQQGYINNGYSGGFQQQQPYQQPINQQPIMQSYQAPQQMNTSMAFVSGPIEARSYMVAPGHRVYLFDTDGHTYYVKAVDFNGMPLPFKTYDYTEVVEPQLPVQGQSYDNQSQIDLSNYIRRDEVENMIAAEVEKRISAMNNGTSKKKGGDLGA